MAADLLSSLRAELKENIDGKTRESGQNFFKEKIKYYGIKTAAVLKISKKYFSEIKDKDKKEIFSLCEKLLKSGYLEESFIAYNWAYELREKFEPSDYKIFESWLNKYVSNWASCDTLCNHTIAAFIEKYPKYIENLKTWAKSDNRWVRRGAAVTLVLPARNGLFLKDVFEIADTLLEDKDDLVQKGYGWLLKEASKKNQKVVFKYIIKNKKSMPRTALRYAIEKMPEDLRKKAMQK